MAQNSKIEWTDASINPVTGCSPISPGCARCYAKRMAHRLRGRYGYPEDEPFKPGVFHPDQLKLPEIWKKPRRIFVCSMGDLFHDDVPKDLTPKVFRTAEYCDHHTFIFLTKRPENMAKLMNDYAGLRFKSGANTPLPENWWAGATVESQCEDHRILTLKDIPAVRFISMEPLIGPFDFLPPMLRWLDWVIVGQETGPGARPAKAEWFLSIIEQCQAAGVPVFIKKAPEGVPIIREFPRKENLG